jgi:hypothetical protein
VKRLALRELNSANTQGSFVFEATLCSGYGWTFAEPPLTAEQLIICPPGGWGDRGIREFAEARIPASPLDITQFDAIPRTTTTTPKRMASVQPLPAYRNGTTRDSSVSTITVKRRGSP